MGLNTKTDWLTDWVTDWQASDSQSQLRLWYGTRLRSHQEDSSAASLHRQQMRELRWPADPQQRLLYVPPPAADSASDRQRSPLRRPAFSQPPGGRKEDRRAV
jgi:hypothetical protein